jgi:hypothetical protein
MSKYSNRHNNNDRIEMLLGSFLKMDANDCRKYPSKRITEMDCWKIIT